MENFQTADTGDYFNIFVKHKIRLTESFTKSSVCFANTSFNNALNKHIIRINQFSA